MERALQRALQEVGWDIVDITEQLQQSEGAPTLLLPWETWADSVPGANTAVHCDAGAHQDADEGDGSGVGLVTRIGNKWWGAAIPEEPWVDNTTAKLLGIALGRHPHQMGAQVVK